MSGSDTISMSGVPARFRSTRLAPLSDGVQVLARVLFEMDPGDADALDLPVDHDLDVPVFADRQLILRYLVALRKVGIEIVLPREPAVGS